MLKVVREEEKEGSRFSVTDLLRPHIENDFKYPLSFLVPYSEKAKLMSLSGLTKQIHQIWIVVRLLREFTLKPPDTVLRAELVHPISDHWRLRLMA